MTVGELKEKLAEFTDDVEVVISIDGEGNDFKRVTELETAMFLPNDAYSGDLVDDDDESEGVEPVVVIWPMA